MTATQFISNVKKIETGLVAMMRLDRFLGLSSTEKKSLLAKAIALADEILELSDEYFDSDEFKNATVKNVRAAIKDLTDQGVNTSLYLPKAKKELNIGLIDIKTGLKQAIKFSVSNLKYALRQRFPFMDKIFKSIQTESTKQFTPNQFKYIPKPVYVNEDKWSVQNNAVFEHRLAVKTIKPILNDLIEGKLMHKDAVNLIEKELNEFYPAGIIKFPKSNPRSLTRIVSESAFTKHLKDIKNKNERDFYKKAFKKVNDKYILDANLLQKDRDTLLKIQKKYDIKKKREGIRKMSISEYTRIKVNTATHVAEATAFAAITQSTGVDLFKWISGPREECAECSSYVGNIYSISGKSNQYPKTPYFPVHVHDMCDCHANLIREKDKEVKQASYDIEDLPF